MPRPRSRCTRGTGCTTADPRRWAVCPPSRTCTRTSSAADPDSEVSLRLTLASDSTDAALTGTVTLVCPPGWSARPAALPFTLPAGEHLDADVVVTTPADVEPGVYPVRAQLAVTDAGVPAAWRQVVEDVALVSVGGADDGGLVYLARSPPMSLWPPVIRPGWPPLSAPARAPTWPGGAPDQPLGHVGVDRPRGAGRGTTRPRHRRAQLRREPAGLGRARPVVGADPDRLRRPAGLLAGGEGDRAMNHCVSSHGGVPVPVERGRRARGTTAQRPARRRAARGGHQRGQATAALAHPADRDRTRGRRRSRGPRCDRRRRARPKTSCCPTSRPGWRSAASPPRRWPTRARGRCSPRHRRRRRQRRRRRRLPRPKPAAIRRLSTETLTAGARRRRPSRRSRRCARRSPSTCGPPRAGGPSGSGWTNAAPNWCSWRPATSIPATRVNPTTPTGTEPPMLTLALDIGGTKIAVGLVDPAGELVHA